MRQEKKKKNLGADLSLLLVAIIWGSGFIVTKYGLNLIPPLYLNAFRFSIAFVMMILIFHKKLRKTNKQNIVGGIIIGLFLYTAFAFQTVGLQFTTAGKQAFLTGTNVIIVPFLYWLVQGKKPDNYSFIATILTFIGIGLLSLENGLRMQLGDSLTIICAFLFACHIVSIGFYTRKNDPIILTVLQFGVAAILSLITAFIFEDMPSNVPTQGILAVIYLGIFSTLIAFLIQNIAQSKTTSTHAAIMLSMESVFGSILSSLLLAEIFTTRMILGCIIIFFAIIIAETKLEFLINSRLFIKSNG